MKPLLLLIVAVCLLAFVHVAKGDGYLDPPKPAVKPATSGNGPRLLLREVYETDSGQRIGLDESTDRPAKATKASPTPEAAAKAERPRYVQHPATGQWWKQYADGSWEYCSECNQQQAAPVATPVYTMPTYYQQLYGVAPQAYQLYEVAPQSQARPRGGFGVFAGFSIGRSGGG